MLAWNPTLRQKEILTGVVALGLSLGSLAAAEAALRVNQVLTFGTVANVEKADTFHIDPATNLRLPVPGARIGNIRVNSQGFRGPEIATPKPPGVIRLAFLGSSTTFDPYVPREDATWPAVATAHLNAAFAGSCKFDYVNAGVPGFGLVTLTRYFDAFVEKMQPDIVVILADEMNGRLNDLATEAGLYNKTRYDPSLLAQVSLFWAKIEKNAEVLTLQRAAHSQKGKLSIDGKDLLHTFPKDLEALVSAVRQAGAQPVLLLPGGELRRSQSPSAQVAAADTDLLYMPYMSIEGLLTARDAYAQSTASVGQHLGVPTLDWTTGVPGAKEDFVDSHHFSPRGALRMGAITGTEITRDPEMQAFFSRLGCRATRSQPPA